MRARFGVLLQSYQLAVDLPARQHGQLAPDLRKEGEVAQRRRHLETVIGAESGRHSRGLAPQLGDQPRAGTVTGQRLEGIEHRFHPPAVLAEHVQELGAAEELVQPCAALHCCDLSHDRLRVARRLDPVQHEPLARSGQARDVERSAHDAGEQRHRHERESKQDQAAERTRSCESHRVILAEMLKSPDSPSSACRAHALAHANVS